MEAEVRTLGLLERVLHLKTLAQLQELPPEELGVVAQSVRERFFRPNAVVWRAGEPVGGVHLVVRGAVHVSGGEYGDARVGPQEALGLVSLLARSDAGLDAVAEDDTFTLEIDQETLLDVFEDHYTILLAQIRELALRSLEARRNVADGLYLAPGEGRPRMDSNRPLTLIERLLYMRQGTALRRANVDALVELASQSRECRYEPGTTLWRRGDASGHLDALVHGRVRCTLEDGRSFAAGPGYPLGNLESLCGVARWYEAVCETPVVSLRNETLHFLDIIEDHFDMAMDFVAALATGLIRLRSEARPPGGTVASAPGQD